jgi:hypothetical protein
MCYQSAGFSYTFETEDLPEGYTVESASDTNGIATEIVRDNNGRVVGQIQQLTSGARAGRSGHPLPR